MPSVHDRIAIKTSCFQPSIPSFVYILIVGLVGGSLIGFVLMDNIAQFEQLRALMQMSIDFENAVLITAMIRILIMILNELMPEMYGH